MCDIMKIKVKGLELIRKSDVSYEQSPTGKCGFQMLDGLLRIFEGLIQILSLGFFEAWFSHELTEKRIERRNERINKI